MTIFHYSAVIIKIEKLSESARIWVKHSWPNFGGCAPPGPPGGFTAQPQTSQLDKGKEEEKEVKEKRKEGREEE